MFLAGCDHRESLAPYYKENHLLRQVYTKEQVKSHIDGSFFLGIGGISGGTSISNEFIFWWRWRDGSYLCNKIAFDKMRISIEEIDAPYITFELISQEDGRHMDGTESNPQEVVGSSCKLDYATIHIKSQDFPLYISITPKQ